MAREDQFISYLTVGGADEGAWDSFDGGETDSEDTKYKPAAMPSISLGGAVTVGNITLGRLYQKERDISAVTRLRAQAGRASVVVSRQALDENDQPFGKPEVFTGKLKAVTPPSSDSTSSDAAMITVEISPDSSVS